jgi:hypothetical protein
MLTHSHGGTLLIVPAERGSWEKFISWGEEPYKARQAFRKPADDVVALEARADNHEALGSYERSLRLIGQLTAVDGATVITRDLAVLGFGAKIDSQADPDHLVNVGGPLEDSATERPQPISKLGGTRHQSAARFVRDNKDSIAVVASQDGVLSFVVWDDEAQGGGSISVIRHAEWQLL